MSDKRQSRRAWLRGGFLEGLGDAIGERVPPAAEAQSRPPQPRPPQPRPAAPGPAAQAVPEPRRPSPPPWLVNPEPVSARVRGPVGPGAPLRRPPRPGIFTIDPGKCLAWPKLGGTSCAVCEERCPLEGAVIRDGGRPRIDPEVCDGCGLCVPGCPAPVLAIRWQPRPPVSADG